MSSRCILVQEPEGVMKSTLAILLVTVAALVVAQQNAPYQKPASSKPSAAANPALEQRTVAQQNQALNVSFAQAFAEDTPEEFHLMVVELYVRCQAELDNCADLLWETHLLREYRKCALTQRRFCTQEIQELQSMLEALVAAGDEQVSLTPEEEEVLRALY
ncbi:uncharacterized protein LOC131291121 [Anopheles ziemanni]|uniref:uncharacterized protein LOC131269285 n=1 Tax=Anopheles coustani TaxID=139045 RepID=UPI00265AA883|nr:uncharacterized protein LOC131269285 [Anopheles coustani]XP_058176295.1 uncharacterized protein LOC131291121 [Anopheles ziemanni]